MKGLTRFQGDGEGRKKECARNGMENNFATNEHIMARKGTILTRKDSHVGYTKRLPRNQDSCQQAPCRKGGFPHKNVYKIKIDAIVSLEERSFGISIVIRGSN